MYKEEPFLDEVIFTMDPDLIDWNLVEELSESDPDSREYRKMMKDLKIQGRNKRYNNKFKKEIDDYE